MAATPGQGTGGKNLSAEQIIALWLKAGGTVATAPMALARALAESGGNAQVTSSNPDGGTNVGVWQLDTRGVGSGHSVSQLQDPLTNAKITVKATRNGSNWSEWADQYQTFISQASHDVASFELKGGGSPGGLSGLVDNIMHSISEAGGDAGKGIAAVAGQLLQLPSQVTDLLSALEQPVQKLMWIVNPGNWARIIAGLFGFLLLGAGLITLGMAGT